VGNELMSVRRKLRIGRCISAIRFFVFAVLGVLVVLALVGALYFLTRRWL
jgi:hypothetical protein